MRNIAFRSGQDTCYGVHYFPSNRSVTVFSDRSPCVILAHGFGGTAASGLDLYARMFAEAGLHAIAFDYRHFGRSEGRPRQCLSIRRQLQDWQAAVDFARVNECIDAERIILWGVSLAGGHVIRTAARDGRINAVIAEFPMLDGLAAMRNIIGYAGYRQILRLLVAGIDDLMRVFSNSQPRTIPVVGKPGELAALSTPDAEPGYRAIVSPDWENAVCARIALTMPFYRPGYCLKKTLCPILVQVADLDTILPRLSIERFLHMVNPLLQVRHYQARHFDAFNGAIFKYCMEDQLNFIMTVLDNSFHENNPPQ